MEQPLNNILLQELQLALQQSIPIATGFSASIHKISFRNQNRVVKIIKNYGKNTRTTSEFQREVRFFESIPPHTNICEYIDSVVDNENSTAYIILQAADTDAWSL